jgi:ATP-binding cassette subfamily C exporter for protease/lipase
VTKFVQVSLQSLILGFGALLVLEPNYAGMMIAASILVGRTWQPVQQVIGVWKNWASTRSAYERLTALLAANPPRETGMTCPPRWPADRGSRDRGAAERAGADPAQSEFRDPAGDVLGVIGPAAGKSTLARLLVGVWPAAAGKVRLDGADIYQWNKAELGPHIGYLPQDIELFAVPSATTSPASARPMRRRWCEAAKRAGVHDMILHLPKGYDTPLGDGGAGLSGGQKQRLGLARAMYGDPALIVLDEPNSNLDDLGEMALVQAINDLRQRGKTIILITHRTNVISATNKLLLLRDGVVNMFGPTQEVLKALQEQNQRAIAQAQAQAPAKAPAPAAAGAEEQE